MDIFLNVVGIVAVVGLGSFAVAFVLDLLLVIFAPKRNGVFFHRAKKSDKAIKKPVDKTETAEKAPVTVKETAITTNNMPTITPFLELQETEDNFGLEEELSEVDFDKAVQEQKMLQNKKIGNIVNPTEPDLFSTKQTSAVATNFVEPEDEDDEDEDDYDISDIISEVQVQALKELEEEEKQESKKPAKAEQVKTVDAEEDAQEVVLQKQTLKDVPKIKVAKLIFKTGDKQPVKNLVITDDDDSDADGQELKSNFVEQPVLKSQEPVIIERIVEKVFETPNDDVVAIEEEEISELRKIREDIYNLRVNTYKDLHASKKGVISKATQKEIGQVEESIREKLSELENLKQDKINSDTEKQALINTNLEINQEKDKLTHEIQTLEAELENLKQSVGMEHKPYYSKEYYETRLQELEAELAEVSKELRLNKREFNPLKRIKRTFERDVVKLRRKEAIVAKQKLKIYGVNNAEDIDSEKLAKLNEEVQVLTNLKDSVHQCEVVLKQNKDRYPVLERTNKILTRRVESLNKDIASIHKLIEWYDTNKN